MSFTNVQPLLNYLENYWQIEESTVKILEECVVEKKLKRREHLLTEGRYCKHLNFVVKGVVRVYHTDKNGGQHNLQFASEGKWLTDFNSLYNNIPSALCIQTLEPSTILQIKQNDLFHLYDNSPLFDRNMRIVTENAFILQQERVLQHISATAYKRYLYFLQKYPEVSNRISNVQIASYIGVTPEFLSAIRKKISNKG